MPRLWLPFRSHFGARLFQVDLALWLGPSGCAWHRGAPAAVMVGRPCGAQRLQYGAVGAASLITMLLALHAGGAGNLRPELSWTRQRPQTRAGGPVHPRQTASQQLGRQQLETQTAVWSQPCSGNSTSSRPSSSKDQQAKHRVAAKTSQRRSLTTRSGTSKRQPPVSSSRALTPKRSKSRGRLRRSMKRSGRRNRFERSSSTQPAMRGGCRHSSPERMRNAQSSRSNLRSCRPRLTNPGKRVRSCGSTSLR